MLVAHVPEWPQKDSAIGTEGDVYFLIFPQGGQKLRLYTCTALDQRRRYIGPAGRTGLDPTATRTGLINGG
jgi:hypothetical protein